MTIFCIKEVKCHETIVFRRFYHYQAIIFEETLEAINEQEEKHILFSIRDPKGWQWLYEHFS